MRIFLTDLQAYNEGYLVGKWVEVPISDEDWCHALSEVLNEGEAIAGSEDHEEWFITDYELPFDIGEYESIDSINETASIYEGLDDDDLIKLSYLINDMGYEAKEASEILDDVELYKDTTLEDLAYDMVDEGLFGEIPESIINYIDYDKIARDLEMDYAVVDGNILRSA